MKRKKKIRRTFRESVYQRDDYTCKVCGIKRTEDELDAHHITDRSKMPNGGYVKSNSITVCKDECHMKVEEFHITDGNNWYPGLHPNDLYEMIDSTYEDAVEDSNGLR